MNQEKIGQFIKNIRKSNNLTQDAFAKKLGVTFQAVSKWENGKSIPDVSVLKLISEIFDVEIGEILEGKTNDFNNRNKKKIIIIVSLIVLGVIMGIISLLMYFTNNHHDFEFKTISTTCKDFKINGSAAYNHDKTSIYISYINYCGKDTNNVYKTISCNLYENYGDTITLVSKCDEDKENATLEDFLKDVEIKVDNYSATCKKFKDSYLYLEINAVEENDKNITYKIPITLKDNC